MCTYLLCGKGLIESTCGFRGWLTLVHKHCQNLRGRVTWKPLVQTLGLNLHIFSQKKVKVTSSQNNVNVDHKFVL